MEGQGAAGDFAAFLRVAREVKLDRLGPGPGLLMSSGAYLGPDGHRFPPGLFDSATGVARLLPFDAIREDVSHAWMRDSAAEPANAETIPDMSREGAYSFAKAPRLAGRAVEVGALARQAVAGHPLIRDLLTRAGASNVFSRVVARLLEIAILTQTADSWARDLRLGEPFCTQDGPARDGPVTGFVEAARGALGHWATFRDGHILRYQIVAPTTWNFSPRDANGAPGPLEFALRGLEVGDEGASCCCGAAYRPLLRPLHGLHRALIGYSLSAAGNLIFIARIASMDRARPWAINEIARELASPMRWPASCRLP